MSLRSYKHKDYNSTIKSARLQPVLAVALSIAAVPQCFGLNTSNEYMSYSLQELLNVKLTTASKLPEELRETPGAVSIITRDEIGRSGARTLLDLLVSRVPGFNTLQDNNEHLAAVRGIYATTNQKVLLLRNGQRLNEFLFENFEPDYSIALHNIKQIEIIRGPGASLYGNASLTAVINIITLPAEEIEQDSLKAEIGNHGQRGLQGLFHRYWDSGDIILHASVNNTDGETFSLSAAEDYGSSNKIAGSMVVDDYLTSYDLGLVLKERNWALHSSYRSSGYTQPKGNDGQTIDNDTLPFYLRQNFHYFSNNLRFELDWNDFTVTLNHYYDFSSFISWQMVQAPQDNAPYGKAFQLRWDGYRAGIEYTGIRAFSKGSATIGFSMDHRELTDSEFSSNFASSDTFVLSDTPLLPNGQEYSYALYSQLKYRVNDTVIVNGGLRLDAYEDFGSTLNPRLAIIVNPNSTHTLKWVYSEAFQAPAYFYRNSNPNLGYAATDALDPERSKIHQFSWIFSDNEHFYSQTNLFYNRVSNLITRDRAPDPNIYVNIGQTTTYGLESEFSYYLKNARTWLNYTLQRASNSETEGTQLIEGQVNAIPEHTVNTGIEYDLNDQWSVNTHIYHASNSTAKTEDGAWIYLPSYTLLNTHLAYTIDNLEYTVSIHNLGNRYYRVGGSAPPTPQQGRWFTAGVKWSF